MNRAGRAPRRLCQLVCRPILERFGAFSCPPVRYWDDVVPRADGGQDFLAAGSFNSVNQAVAPTAADSTPPTRRDEPTSNRSRFMTLSHAATKSRTNFSFASSHA